MTKKMVMVFILIQMAGATKVNGAMASNTAKVCLSALKVYLAKENGKTGKDCIGKMK